VGVFKVIALFLLLLGWTGMARAQVARSQVLSVAVTVEASSEALDCPPSAQLLSAVELILERPLENVAAADAPVSVEVHFSHVAEEYRARLVFRGKTNGERQLSDSSPDCAALAEAVSVTMALFFDQEIPKGASEQKRADHEADKAKAAPPVNAETTTPPRVRAQGLVGAAFGLGAKSSAILGGETSVAFDGLQVGASFEATTPTEVSLEPGQVRTSLLMVSLHGCFMWGQRWALGPCAYLGGGLMRGTGIGYEQEAKKSLWWTALGPGFSFRGPLGASDRFFWGARGVLWIPTQTQVFSVENVGVAWQSAPLQGTLSATLGARIW
jgi:hypothetical protein